MIDLPQAIDRKLELILMAARDTSSGIHSPASLADMRRRGLDLVTGQGRAPHERVRIELGSRRPAVASFRLRHRLS